MKLKFTTHSYTQHTHMKKSADIHIRATIDNKAMWVKKSELEGITLSRWITKTLTKKVHSEITEGKNEQGGSKKKTSN